MEKQKLKQIRKQKGFSQQEMANSICTDVSNYCRKEKGYVGITKQEWRKLATALNVSEEDIYQANESVNNPCFDNSSITNQNVGISAPMLKQLLDYITLLKEENSRLKQEIEKKR
ncbi:MAG: helix-turn-helix domain-containing protein [Prevotellaceae bacterium]|nr:helix-turn-helix domain-containing protein [Prevotellaceae bacterium]